MFLHQKFDRKTGVYRSKDNIDNFRFRITLKTLHSFVKVPKFDVEQLNDAEDLDEIEFYNFQWQQKEFSSKEIERYSKLENCKNDRQKDYHKKITEDNRYLDENGDICYSGKIFSYVNDEEFRGDEAETSELAKFIELSGNLENNSDFVDGLIPEEAAIDEIKRFRFKNLGQFESMYIMADLNDEIHLFSIKYRSSDGLLLIYPDLNNIDVNPYLKEINSDTRNLYQFAIENLSMDCHNDITQLRNDIDLLTNRLSDLCIKTPLLFDLPPKNSANVCFYFDIQTAKNFEYDDIHIKYEIHLPVDCQTIDGNAQLKGCTNALRRSSIDGCWLIGYSHELSLTCHLDCLFKDTVKINYEIISIDSWERERVEGYAVYNVPFTCGRYIEKIDCYRDLGDDTWRNWLERYFIGDRRRIQINDFHAITSDDRRILNRYGNYTQSTGQLKINRNVVVQRNIDDIDRHECKIKGNKRKNQKLPTIGSVLLSYNRARRKLEYFADNKEVSSTREIATDLIK